MDSPKKIAAILVGGKGTRLRPLISHVPKPLAPVGKDPFLFLLIRELVRVGYRDILLLTGYRHEAIVDACGDGSAFGAHFIYSREFQPLGTAGAIKQAHSFLSSYTEFLLLNGDTYLDDFATLANVSLQNAIGLIGVIKPENNDRYGSILFDETTKHILNFKEKNQAEACYVNAGIYKLSTSLLNDIPDKQCCSLETDIFPLLIEKKNVFKAVALQGQFYDIGLPESYCYFVESRMS